MHACMQARPTQPHVRQVPGRWLLVVAEVCAWWTDAAGHHDGMLPR